MLNNKTTLPLEKEKIMNKFRIIIVSALVLLGNSALAAPLLADNLDAELLNYSKSYNDSDWNHWNDKAKKILSSGANVNARDGGGYTPLMHASWFGNLELVEILLSNKADINLEAYGRTALTMAITRKHKRVVEFLIRKGANVNSGTALVEAVKTDQIELTQLLLSNGAKVNINDNKLIPISEAAFYGFTKQVKLLLEDKADVDTRRWDGATPLMLSAKGGFIETADILVKAGADVNLTDKDGDTALISAAEGNHSEVVKLLLDHKADMNVRGASQNTALMIAAIQGNSDVAGHLLRAGANPEVQLGAQSQYGGTALHLAAQYGNRDVAALLLEYKADIHAKDRYGVTPLVRAADLYHDEDEEGKVAVANLLISKGAMRDTDKSGESALIYASMRGFYKMAELLIDKGADINFRDGYKDSALSHASRNCNTAIIVKLISAGIKPDTRHFSTTPLMSTAQRCDDIKIQEVLLKAGADVNAQDDLGRTPLDIAIGAGHAKIAVFLKLKGGRVGHPISEGLEILSPKPGDTFTEGDTITLVVKPSLGTPKLLSVGVDEGYATIKSPCNRQESSLHSRYICKYVIPAPSGHWAMVPIIGFTADGGLVSHHVPIAIKMPPGVVLNELSVSTLQSDGKIFMSIMKDSSQLFVKGLYSDGTKREIADSASGTTYETSDPQIATVDSEGKVSPVASGDANIIVRNSDKSLRVPVIIRIDTHINKDARHRVAHKIKKKASGIEPLKE